MTLLKPRPARIAACLLAGALVVAPLSANAAPSGVMPGDDPVAASNENKDKDEDAKSAAKAEEAAAKEAAREAEAEAREAARVAEAAAKEAARAAEAAARAEEELAEIVARAEDKPAETVAREEEKATEGDPGAVVAGPGGGAAGSGGASPGVVSTALLPSPGGSIDVKLPPAHVGAAIVMFDQIEETSSSATPPVVAPTGMVSDDLIRGLAPALPPALMDVVAAPFMVLEALIDAMAASGQALVIPFLAGAVGLMAPGLRRKNLLAEALGRNPRSGS
jgi:hypothetical protein